MALTPTIQASQLDITSVVAGSEMAASQFDMTMVYGFPTEFEQVSQFDIGLVGDVGSDMQVSQFDMVAVMRGNISHPDLRAWWFELDGHEFYVLNLGDDKTLLVDITQDPPRWAWWSNPEAAHWRARIGTNWTQSGSVAYLYGSDVIVGDDSTGILWALAPLQGYDDSVQPEKRELGVKVPFPRVATGQVLARGREFIPCYEVYLVGDFGNPAFTGAAITLQYSDTQGESYVSAGPIVARAGDFKQEFVWRSLGQVQAPGRMFRLVDDGAIATIQELSIANV